MRNTTITTLAEWLRRLGFGSNRPDSPYDDTHDPSVMGTAFGLDASFDADPPRDSGPPAVFEPH